jgi:hypothetical protein
MTCLTSRRLRRDPAGIYLCRFAGDEPLHDSTLVPLMPLDVESLGLYLEEWAAP